MTPMEELRNGLDERGVRHMDFTKCGTGRAYPKYDPDRTHWSAHGGAFKFTSQEVDGILYVKTSGSNKWVEMTPEQAIAATVGAGTCHMKLLENMHTSAYQDMYECDECGERVLRETYMGKSEPPKFCPNCGRKAVSE